jgi:hypothetical protein
MKMHLRMNRQLFILLALGVFSAFSLTLRENYPFSHFPMYGNPSDDVYYHWLADAEQQPLPVAKLTGKTAPKLGKMLRTYTELRAKELKLKRKALPQPEVDKIGMQLLNYLRQEALTIGQNLPNKMILMRTDISYVEGRLIEVATPVFAE